MKNIRLRNISATRGKLTLYRNELMENAEDNRLYLVVYEQEGFSEEIMELYKKVMYKSATLFVKRKGNSFTYLQILSDMMKNQADYFFWGHEIIGASVILQDENGYSGWAYGALSFEKGTMEGRNPSEITEYRNGKSQVIANLRLTTTNNIDEPDYPQSKPSATSILGWNNFFDKVKAYFVNKKVKTVLDYVGLILIAYVVYVIISELLSKIL